VFHTVNWEKEPYYCLYSLQKCQPILMQISGNIAEGMLNLHIWKSFVFSLNILCQQQCKKDTNDSSATAAGFATEDQHLIKQLWHKTVAKQSLKMLFDRRWKLDRLNTLVNKISAISLTLLIFATRWAVCGWPQPGTLLVNDASTVIFTVKCLIH